MRKHEVEEIIAGMEPRATRGNRISFEWFDGRFLKGDYFPERDEALLPNEETAWAWAKAFAEATQNYDERTAKGRPVNIYVIDAEYKPVAGYRERMLRDRAKEIEAEPKVIPPSGYQVVLWHWLKKNNPRVEEALTAFPPSMLPLDFTIARWANDGGFWYLSGEAQQVYPDEMHKQGWRYLKPVMEP
jgi:hypothetical protein